MLQFLTKPIKCSNMGCDACRGTTGNLLCLDSKALPFSYSDIAALSNLFNDATTKEQQNRADEVLGEVLNNKIEGALFSNSYLKFNTFSEVTDELTGQQLSSTKDWEERRNM